MTKGFFSHRSAGLAASLMRDSLINCFGLSSRVEREEVGGERDR